MKTRAPGKVVLSGAYAVLAGAPAVVSAVDRYVLCDSARPAEVVTPEVRVALGDAAAPFFDASALRAHGRKLGLGSSAAILVASLAAQPPERWPEDEPGWREALARLALRAHHEAQGGGSGIDVVASVWGGTSIVSRRGEELDVRPLTLPAGLVIEMWGSPVAASTAELLACVRGFARQEPGAHARIMADLRAAADRAALALSSGDVSGFITAVARQRELLDDLGRAAGTPIITDAVRRLAAVAGAPGTALPSGAGGGDIVLWLGEQPSPPEFRELAERLDHFFVPGALHARGVERLFQGGLRSHGT